MLGLPLAFTVPLALVALAGLPVLYVLLRVTPPRPQRVPFPPLKLILDLRSKDETPANTPPWLLLLRLLLAACVIAAMAGPIWPRSASRGRASVRSRARSRRPRRAARRSCRPTPRARSTVCAR